MNPLLFPPALFKRAVEDLAALAEAAGSLPQLVADVAAMRRGVDALRADLAPIQEVPALRRQLEALRDELAPIAELHRVREGIEPLDEDMRAVRDSVDHLEPLIKQVNARLATLDKRIETLRADLSPLGDLADKLPGIGR